MHIKRPMEIVFLTNFSNSSYRAIPAMAQLIDELESRLTILHASEPPGYEGQVAQSRLASFFPEADAYRGSRRVAFRGTVIDAVHALRKNQFVDLIVAPSADPLSLPRLFHRSLRARLIADCGTPVWTMGQAIHSTVLNGRTKNVGCWIDLSSKDAAHVGLAVEYASRLNAKLHLLHALPDIDEGSITLPLFSNQPLCPEGALSEIRRKLEYTAVIPEIRIETGSYRKAMPRMVRELGLNVLFVDEKQATTNWLTGSVSGAVDRCACPVICCPSSVPRWLLQGRPTFASGEIASIAA